MEIYQDLTEGFQSSPLYETLDDHCRYSIRIYPTEVFEDSLDPHVPMIFATVVAGTFVLVAAVFCVYDLSVYHRTEVLIANNAQSIAIVSSLFPSNIHDRLINPIQDPASGRRQSLSLKSFMTGNGERGEDYDNKPLADLFLECTVMFANVAGFTAWSSVREPTQVFTLLETVYCVEFSMLKLWVIATWRHLEFPSSARIMPQS